MRLIFPILFLYLSFIPSNLAAETQKTIKTKGFPRTTWSIAYRNPDTGQFIAATSSKYFNVIHRVCRVRAGAGLVISQGRGNPMYFSALDKLEKGENANKELKNLLAKDLLNSKNVSSSRQVAIIDNKGNIAVHTGSDCGQYAKHIKNESAGYVILGNGLTNKDVLKEIDNFLKKDTSPMMTRIAKALNAGAKAGGEVRPESSAGVCYSQNKNSGKWWEDSGEFISVAESKNPTAELISLVQLEQSRLFLEKAFEQFELRNPKSGSKYFKKAESLNPNDPEIPLWHSFFLFKSEQNKEALNILTPALKRSHPWGKEMLLRFGGKTGADLIKAHNTH